MLVLELANHGQIAGLVLGPQVLLELLAIVRDERVRDREDRLRGAIVLLQANDAGVRKVLLEVKDVAYVRATEAVDRLRVVAHHEEAAVFLREQLEEPV